MAPSQVAMPANEAERDSPVASGEAPTDTTSLQEFGPFTELVRYLNTMITLPGHGQNTIEELLQVIMTVITTMAMVLSKRDVEQAFPNPSVSSPGSIPAFDYSDKKDTNADGKASTIRGPNVFGTIKDSEINASQDAAARDQFYGWGSRGKESQQEEHNSGEGGCTPYTMYGGNFGNISNSKVNTQQRVAGRDQVLPQGNGSMTQEV